MKMAKHKHYDCIIAWANGAEIEYFNSYGKWVSAVGNPLWGSDTQYRVKPKTVMVELPLNVVKYAAALESGLCSIGSSTPEYQVAVACRKALEEKK